MNDLYIAEDGTVHRRNRASPASNGGGSNRSNRSYRNDTSYYETAAGRKGFYWLYAIISALVVGFIMAGFCGEADLGSGEFIEFFEGILPLGVVGGALLGSVVYGCNGAERRAYNLGAFVLTTLSAVGTALGIGFLICLAPFVLTFVWYIFLAVLIIGVVVGVLSGGG